MKRENSGVFDSRIKFKAWNLKTRKMIIPTYLTQYQEEEESGFYAPDYNGFMYVSSPYFSEEGDVEDDNYLDGGLEQGKHFLLLQYTGQKDKHNTPLFVGDIIKYQEFPFGPTSIKYNPLPPVIIGDDISYYTPGIVIFEDGCFSIKDLYGDETLLCDFNYEFEIFGNYYENPELRRDNSISIMELNNTLKDGFTDYIDRIRPPLIE